MKDYGNAIKVLRKKKQMTQTTLAEKLNISGQAVSKWENNLAQPDFDTILKITEIFGISLDEFSKLISPSNAKATLDEDGETETTKKVQDKLTEVSSLSDTEATQTKNGETEIIKKEKYYSDNLIAFCSECGGAIYDYEDLGEAIYEEDDIEKLNPKVICIHCKERRERKKTEAAKIKVVQQNVVQKKPQVAPHKKITLAEQMKNSQDMSTLRKKLIIPAVVIGIIYAIILIIILAGGANNKGLSIAGWSVLAVLSYLTTTQILWDNNAIAEIFFWSYHRVIGMPGLIIPLSIDGIIWAICVKILLFFVGIILSLLLTIFGIILCLLLSPFFFGFSLNTLIKEIKQGTIV